MKKKARGVVRKKKTIEEATRPMVGRGELHGRVELFFFSHFSLCTSCQFASLRLSSSALFFVSVC